jgi:DNA polymerase-3 subunit delta'
MLFDNLLGQEVAKRTIRRAWDEGRLAQSYLFYGPDGVGKEAAAMDLARAVNCGAQEKPCRECSSCRRISSYQHPDFHYLAPMPHSNSESERRKIADELAEQLKEKAAQPHRPLTFDRPTAISIDDIRELRQGLSLHPYEGGRQAAVIAQADRMTEEAGNAFLKMLEEPSPSTIFILVSDRPNALLPTIVSRCQKVRFDLLPAGAIEAHLLEKHHLPEVEAKLMADLAGGSLGRALEMLEQGFWEERDMAWGILESALNGDFHMMLHHIGQASSQRGRPDRVLNLIEEVAQDMLHLRHGQKVVNGDRTDRLRNLERRLSGVRLEAMVSSLEKAKAALRQNVTPKLCLIAAVAGNTKEFGDPEI